MTDAPATTASAPATPAPAVSVIMPVYNGKAYVADAVQSILDQTFRDFELLALDDGSTDGSTEILQQFADRDGRVRPVTQSHVGYVPLLNKGIALARGDFLARMDADDVADPRRLERQVAYLRQHPDCVLVGGQALLIDAEGLPIANMPGLPLDHAAIDAALMTGGWPIVHPAITLRRDAVRAVGGYDESARPHEDHDLFLRLAERGTLANLPEVVLRYRKHYNSVTYAEDGVFGHKLDPLIRAAYRRRGLPEPAASPVPPRHLPPRALRLFERRNWCWWALKAGNVRTARKHAFALVRAAPWSIDSWRVMYCALRGR
jgi:glycosyltransferase involved in cell wall biosynthesis